MTHAAPEPSELEATSTAVPADAAPEATSNGAGQSSHGGGATGLLSDIASMSSAANPNDASGLARLAGKSFMRAMGALSKGAVENVTGIAKDVSSGEPITDILDTRVEAIRHAALDALGLDNAGGVPKLKGSSYRDLRAHGDALLASSWNIANQPRDEHPAFAQILSSITPDEARILRFLRVAGAQPSMDIRTKTPFGVGSERIAGGINMIADMAGCAWVDRDQHYLANLNRLGLVRFSEEPVEDFRRYSILTAHQDAVKAYTRAKKTIDVYRSIYLSLFGRLFVDTCFTTEGYDAGGWVHDERGDKYLGKGPRMSIQ